MSLILSSGCIHRNLGTFQVYEINGNGVFCKDKNGRRAYAYYRFDYLPEVGDYWVLEQLGEEIPYLKYKKECEKDNQLRKSIEEIYGN